MILYLLKTAICSGLLLLAYHLLLANEKMFRFNRLYLLSAIVLSFYLPTITFKTTSIPAPVMPVNNIDGNVIVTMLTPHEMISMESKINFLAVFAGTIYITVALLLFVRFAVRVNTLLRRVKNHAVVPYKDAMLVLMEGEIMPYSFGRYLYVNKQDFEKGLIREEILYHELIHIRQYHSLDVLFVEFIRIITWFNPLFYYYRNAIQLNHEYLADDAVVQKYDNTPGYQGLLVACTTSAIRSSPASQFNFITIKKRLIMMTKTLSFKRALLKQLALVPFIAGLIFICCTKSVAQVKPSAKKLVVEQVESTTTGITPELQEKYNGIIERNKRKTLSGRTILRMSEIDRDSLETIFKLMTKEQQATQVVIFEPPTPPLPRIIPTQDQFESFKDPALYGLWIDEKKVPNSELEKYNHSDFAQVFISKLYGGAKQKYVYQLDLMTTEYYNAYHKRAIENKHLEMLYRRPANDSENQNKINSN